VSFFQTPLDLQSSYGSNIFQTKWALHYWNYLSLLKVLNFKQRLWLAKRKTSWHATGNVRYCPTLPPSALRHLRPPHVHNLNRSYTKHTGTSNVTVSAANSSNQAHSSAVYWTPTNLIITAYLKKICLPVNTLISWKHTKVVVHWTQLTLPVWRQVTAAFLWYKISIKSLKSLQNLRILYSVLLYMF
jgi:hypothetical protein